jgi:hypothetical protein
MIYSYLDGTGVHSCEGCNDYWGFVKGSNIYAIAAILAFREEACLMDKDLFLNLNPGQPRTLLQLKLVGILMINLFLT